METNKKILINAQWYDPALPTGVGNYFRRLAKKVFDLSMKEKLRFIIFHSGRSVFQDYKKLEEKKSVNVLDSSFRKLLWENIKLPLYIFRNKPDIFYSINYSIPFILPENLRVVATVHDLIWFLFPRYFSNFTVRTAIWRMKRTVNRADLIITNSENTKKDLIRYFRCSPTKIKVIYPGIDLSRYQNINPEFAKRFLRKHNITNPYFVWVGAPRPTKNIEKLCESFIEANLGEVRLYIVGPAIFQFNYLKKRYQNEKKIVFLTNISDEELLVLYSNSIALVYPSLYEGFGLPVLEAMASNTLVITSGVSSLPEVGGKCAFYINPTKKESIIKMMQIVRDLDEDTRKKILKKQYDYIKDNFDLGKQQEYFKNLLLYETREIY